MTEHGNRIPRLTRMNEKFAAAWSVVMLIMLPGLTVAGASVMLGRTASVPSVFSKYGGV